MFLEVLHNELDQYHLLKHPFYKAWTEGKLTLGTLQIYAQEYYHHVAAFPRYISAIHSKCNDIKTRQVLLNNLIEEEQGEENHPELWQRFVEGLQANRITLQDKIKFTETENLVDGYFQLTDKDFATGLGALYAYERQTPAVSKSKIEGLKEFYNINDERTLKFFNVHMEADEWHTEECANLISKLSAEDQQKALHGAIAGAKLLWKFLDVMMKLTDFECTTH